MIKRYLLSPGPTPVPDEVQRAMAQTIIHHRTPEFSQIFAEARKGLKALFGTQRDVLILASSGTGAMEAAVANLFSPGDKVLVINGGKFGERWLRIAGAFGLKPVELKVEWGKAVTPQAVEEQLKIHPDTQGILVQASETSTTVLHPVRDIARLCRSGPLLIVDGITAIGVLPVPMDKWEIDVLVGGSQKALMLPPGLGFIALSERAWDQTAQARLPRFYFDLKQELKNQRNETTAFTAPVSLVFGLHAAIEMIYCEGLERVFARHERMARATRAAATALGLKLLAPDHPSPCATGIFVPGEMDGEQLLEYLRARMGVTFAEGQDHLKGKIVPHRPRGLYGGL